MPLSRRLRSAGARRRPGKPSRWRRWVLRSLAGVVALLALIVGVLVLLLHSLDQPWLKSRLLQRVRMAAGVALDYRTARVDLLSGAVIEGVVVQSPPEVRSFAPELLGVGHVEARWSPRSLLGGYGPIIERVAVSDLTLTTVVDEDGRTSFDALSPSSPSVSPAPSTTTPWSGQAAKLLASAPPVGKVDLENVTLIVVQTERNEVTDRTELRGLALSLVASSAGPTESGWRVDASLGTPAAPLALQLTRAPRGTEAASARGSFWLDVTATAKAVNVGVDLRILDQTFVSSVSADHWIHADAALRFDPAAGRTTVTLEHAEAGDGALTAEASIEVPDAGDPLVRHAAADADLARLLRWVPAGLVPVTAERARAHLRIDSLVAHGPLPSLTKDGALAVDAEVSNVVAEAPSAHLELASAKLSVRAQPSERGGMAGRGTVALTAVRLASAATIAAEGVALDFDGERGADEVVTGHLGARFERAELGGPNPIAARGGHFELHLDGLHPDLDEPVGTRGDMSASIELASLDARSSEAHTAIDGLTLTAHTSLSGAAPYSLALETVMSRVRAVGHDGRLLLDTPARVDAKVRDVQPDAVHPAASRGALHAKVDLGGSRASLDATKGTDALDYALDVTLPSLRIARAFLLPAQLDRAPWDRMGAAIRSTGRIAPLGGAAPGIHHTTEVEVAPFAYGGVGARSIALSVKSQGTAIQHRADVELRTNGLTFGGGPPSDDHVTLSATLDRTRPSLQLQLATEGRAATKISVSASFDAARKAVRYDVDGHLGGLAALSPFASMGGLDGLDLTELEVGWSAHGSLLGFVDGIGRDGRITLAAEPARTASVEGKAGLEVSHFHFARGDVAFSAPVIAWSGDMHVEGQTRAVESRLEVASMHLDVGIHGAELKGIHDEETVRVSGDLTSPDLSVSQHLAIDTITQDFVSGYPLGDLTVALSGERDADGVVHLTRGELANGLAGTVLAGSGNVDLTRDHRRLSLDASLTQDLARLTSAPYRFTGRGKVGVEAKVSSTNLALYTVRAVVKGDGVSVSMPSKGIEVDTASGEVPITMVLDVTNKKGVWLERGARPHPYSMLRFADQHPLLTNSGFLSIARLKTPYVSMAPLVGSLEIDQNMFSLRQFEMGVRGGTITGQCVLDWEGRKSTLELHVRASGVQSSHGEPFDGNTSVLISAADRSVEGRAEIVRIGERHLLDLLDLEDPSRVDPAMNRIRTALSFGYPDSVRLVFEHGFASAHLEMGGLARFISIGDVRGIPMGPLVDKMLAPVLGRPDTKE